MEEFRVISQEETHDGWQFRIALGDAEYTVLFSEEYWRGLTGGSVSPETLVEDSFAFLLEREPKESILASFSLPQIQGYFPEYEETMQEKYISKTDNQ